LFGRLFILPLGSDPLFFCNSPFLPLVRNFPLLSSSWRGVLRPSLFFFFSRGPWASSGAHRPPLFFFFPPNSFTDPFPCARTRDWDAEATSPSPSEPPLLAFPFLKDDRGRLGPPTSTSMLPFSSPPLCCFLSLFGHMIFFFFRLPLSR